MVKVSNSSFEMIPLAYSSCSRAALARANLEIGLPQVPDGRWLAVTALDSPGRRFAPANLPFDVLPSSTALDDLSNRSVPMMNVLVARYHVPRSRQKNPWLVSTPKRDHHGFYRR